MKLRYASVCSGVEAASLAWMPLGWEAAWFSEIEPFPCAVLEERFPSVPNLGDMTKIHYDKEKEFTYVDGTDTVVHGGIDLLVGGTPCQSFSVAGKREGLEGASGLAYHFVRLLREIQPRFFVWENVPGCLSSRTKGVLDFNFLLNAYAEGGYACAWRVLDSQYTRISSFPYAIPQRRRRLFIVGHLGDDLRYPAEILLEPSRLPRDTPPRREKRKGFAADAHGGAGEASRFMNESGKGYYVQSEVGGTLEANEDQHRRNLVCMTGSFMGGRGAKAGSIGFAEEVTPTIKASPSGGNQVPDIICVHGSQDPICNDTHANALNRNNGLENCVVCFRSSNPGDFVPDEVSGTIKRNAQSCGNSSTTLCYDAGRCGRESVLCVDGAGHESGDITPTLQANLEKQLSNQTPVVVCYDARGNGDGRTANTITGDHGNRVTDYTPLAIALAENTIGRKPENGGNGIGAVEEVAYTQNATGVMGVASTLNAHYGDKMGLENQHVNAGCPNFVVRSSTVRRLLPVECERLMGFPDNWTRIPWRGKAEEDCPDAPRYKACGNSMCVNVMRWIGERINAVAEELK